MTPLPDASPRMRADFLQWLESFAGYVRAVNYESAIALFHPEVIAFGTHNDVITGISEWLTSQWVNVWPKTENFRFDNAMTRVLSSDDQCLVTVIAPWTSTGFHEDGTAFDRPGRATLIFQRTNFGWSCIHSHMSLNRGVPQASYGRRVGWLERLVSVRAPVAA